MRKIIVFSTTAGRKIEVMTAAGTWGELKNVAEVRGLLSDNMEGAVKETKVSLKSDDAVLPATDCTIFLVQSKTKAGISRERVRQILEEETETFIDELLERLDDEGVIDASDEESLAAEAAQFAQSLK
jgi:hypothetical protein